MYRCIDDHHHHHKFTSRERERLIRMSTKEEEECTIKQIIEGCDKAGLPNDEKTIAYAVGFLAGKLGLGENTTNAKPTTEVRGWFDSLT